MHVYLLISAICKFVSSKKLLVFVFYAYPCDTAAAFWPFPLRRASEQPATKDKER